jgi:hypothetical protein
VSWQRTEKHWVNWQRAGELYSIYAGGPLAAGGWQWTGKAVGNLVTMANQFDSREEGWMEVDSTQVAMDSGHT